MGFIEVLIRVHGSAAYADVQTACFSFEWYLQEKFFLGIRVGVGWSMNRARIRKEVGERIEVCGRRRS